MKRAITIAILICGCETSSFQRVCKDEAFPLPLSGTSSVKCRAGAKLSREGDIIMCRCPTEQGPPDRTADLPPTERPEQGGVEGP